MLQVRDGSIRGTILADNGGPVADAHVFAEVVQGSKILTVLNTNADDLGVFAFSQLAFGEYRVSAQKEEAGHLSTRPDIFTCEPALTVVLTTDTPTATTLIRFRPKAGSITGWVRDSATGRSIAAHLGLAPMSGCGWSTTGTAGRFKFRLLVPADTGVKFGARADQATCFRKAATASAPLPHTLKTVSMFVRRSTSFTCLLGETSLSSPPWFFAETRIPMRMPMPPLSTSAFRSRAA